MKKLIEIMYTLFLVLFIDDISLNGIFRGYTTIIILYAIILVLLGFRVISRNDYKICVRSNTKIYLTIVILYLLNILRLNGELMVGVRILSFLTIAFFNAYFAYRYSILDKFIIIFYIVAFGFIFKQFIEAEMPFEAYSSIESIFNQERYRVDFGFYHINAAGNLSSCVLILSLYIITESIMKIEINIKKYASIVIIGLADFIVFSYLIATGSRTAILSLLVFLAVYLYYRFITQKSLRGGVRIFLRLFIGAILLFLIILSLGETAVYFFVTSNRLRNFVNTLPLLDKPNKVLFGLGLSSPGSFGAYDAIDNYYLYIILTMGLFGLAIMCTCLFLIGKHLHTMIYKSKSSVYMLAFAIFVCHMIAGLSENCVLYYIFPSSMIYFTLYFACFEFSKSTNGNFSR